MRTFTTKTPRRRFSAGTVLRAAGSHLRRLQATGEDGFLLVEVMISAMLVALIVTATFNGLDVATRLSSEQRHRNQAELLAAASQEQLRSETASALDELVGSSHSYTQKVSGVTYTIVQEAVTVAASGKTTGCSTTEATASSAGNFRVTSKVTWSQQEKGHRPPVVQSGVITPPIGSGIEVDVINGSGSPVSGVTARAKFIANESGSTSTVEGTTGAAGCVVLSGIQSTEATVEILQKTGYVTRSGALVPPPKELTIAPNVTTHYVVPYAESGAIQAKFTYKGSTSWEGKEVKSDTFVAANPENMETAPEYEVGSSAFTHETTGEEKFEALTGTYASSGSYTAKQSKYPNGDLFPFSSGWTVYAGDCSANKTSTEVEAKPAPIVKSAETTLAEVAVAVTKLTIYTGRGVTEKGSVLAEALKNAKGGSVVKITNTGCEKAQPPNNSTGLVYAHGQKETLAGGSKGGVLENPFQPAGKFKLCLVYSAKKQTYSVNYENLLTTISEPTIYLGQRPNAEVSSEQATAKSEYEAKEPYKEKSGYVNKASEAAAEKAKFEAEKTVYNSLKSKYETEKTAYTTNLGKYNTEKTAYTNDKSKYETEKTAYTTLKSKYETEKTKYETKKAAYEAKKVEYEKSKKASQKTEYETFKAEYEAAQTAYKKYETEYKAAETAYKKYETEYKEAETEYKKYEALYKAAETAYKKYETEYKAAEAEYKKYEAAYKLDEQQATEYQYYLEYKAAKATYEKVTAEQEEAAKSGVTAESKEEC